MTHGLRARRSEVAGPDCRPVDLGDQALLGLVRAGDTAAFAELYERHRLAARRLARRLVHGRVEADDVVAEAFTRVLRVLRRGGGPTDGFRVYLLTAVRRTAWYLQNRDNREFSTDMVDLDRPADGPDLETAAAERGLISTAFLSLPERWRTVLWHTDVEGEPARRVARILGISPNGVAALTYRARGALTAAYLQAHLAEPPSRECRPFAAKLGGYTVDHGGSRERGRIAAHLAGCAECRMRAAELRDVRTSLRAAAGPLLLGPAAAGYLAHTKLAFGLGALVQHGKASAAAAASGAAASGEAVVQLVSHPGRVGAALAGVTLTAAGALGLVATEQSVPEASSPQVVLTVTDQAREAAGAAAASTRPGSPAPAPAPGAGSPQVLPGGRTGAGGGAGGSSASGGTGPTSMSTGTMSTGTGGTGTGGSAPDRSSPDGSGGPVTGGPATSSPATSSPVTSDPGSTTATGPTTTTTAASGQPAPSGQSGGSGGSGGTQPASAVPGTDPSSTTTSTPWPTATSSPISSVTPTSSPTATQYPGPQKAQ